MKSKLMLGIIALCLAVAGFFLYSCQDDWCMLFAWQKARFVQTFEECERLGFSISESYPPQCHAGSKSFTKNIGNEIDKVDLVRINWPRPGGTVKLSEPLIVKGEARGNWFFEASFPVILKDGTGAVVAKGVAQAKGEWMTTDFVPYETKLLFSLQPTTREGVLRLEKDNPSGLPEHDDALEIPVVFEGL